MIFDSSVLSRHSGWRDKRILSRQREWRGKFFHIECIVSCRVNICSTTILFCHTSGTKGLFNTKYFLTWLILKYLLKRIRIFYLKKNWAGALSPGRFRPNNPWAGRPPHFYSQLKPRAFLSLTLSSLSETPTTGGLPPPHYARLRRSLRRRRAPTRYSHPFSSLPAVRTRAPKP